MDQVSMQAAFKQIAETLRAQAPYRPRSQEDYEALVRIAPLFDVTLPEWNSDLNRRAWSCTRYGVTYGSTNL